MGHAYIYFGLIALHRIALSIGERTPKRPIPIKDLNETFRRVEGTKEKEASVIDQTRANKNHRVKHKTPLLLHLSCGGKWI